MIDCKKYADEILDSITGHGYLAVISVGEDPASMSYIRGKKKDCERVGFGFSHYGFQATAKEEEVLSIIDYLNTQSDVTGIIVQLPLPKHLDADRICAHIVPEKDVDGFVPGSPFRPCTPEGIVYLMKRELGDLTGKTATIIGRGRLVGRPLMQMLLDENMTITVCHSKTNVTDIVEYSGMSDVTIAAIGKARSLGLFTKRGAIVIDCGVNRDENGKLCGDVGYSTTERITPVPGGVGLLTRAMLMKHVERQNLEV